MNDLQRFAALDTADLDRLPGPGEVAGFRSGSIRDRRPWSRRPVRSQAEFRNGLEVLRSAIPLLFVLALTASILVVGGPGLLPAVADVAARASSAARLVAAGLLALFAVVILLNVRSMARGFAGLVLPYSWWADELRITRFAERNGLRYGHEEAVALPGVIGREGGFRTAERRFSHGDVEIGVYRYATGRRTATFVHRWGYAAVRLGVAVPNVLLDGRANDRRVLDVGLSDLPIALVFDPDQRMRVGDEFDRAFSTWAPRDAAREVRRLLTPEVTDAMLRYAADFDMELIDDSVFFYGPAFDVTSAAAWQAWTRMIAAVAPSLIRAAGGAHDGSGAPTALHHDEGEVLVTAADVFVDDATTRYGGRRDDPILLRDAEQLTRRAPDVRRRVPITGGRVGGTGRRLDRRHPVLGVALLVLVVATYSYVEWIGPLLGLPLP